MIIDAIYDRYADERDGYGDNYDFKKDGRYIYDEALEFNFDYISRAMDVGSNVDVQKALCRYIDEQDYNPDLKEFIMKKQWVETIVKGMNMAEIIKYAKEYGYDTAYDLLLLGGPEFYTSPSDSYEKMLAYLKRMADKRR